MRSLCAPFLLLRAALAGSFVDEHNWVSEQQKACIEEFERVLVVHQDLLGMKKVERTLCMKFGDQSSDCIQTKIRVEVFERTWNDLKRKASDKWIACQDTMYQPLPKLNDELMTDVNRRVNEDVHKFYMQLVSSLHSDFGDKNKGNVNTEDKSSSSNSLGNKGSALALAEIVTDADTEAPRKVTSSLTTPAAGTSFRESSMSTSLPDGDHKYALPKESGKRSSKETSSVAADSTSLDKRSWWQRDDKVSNDVDVEQPRTVMPQVTTSEPENDVVEHVQQHLRKQPANQGMPVGVAVLIGVLVGLAVAGALVAALVIVLRRMNKKTDLDSSLHSRLEEGINLAGTYDSAGSIVVI